MITKFKLFEQYDDPYGEEIWEDPVYELEVGDIVRNTLDPESYGKIIDIDDNVVTLCNDDDKWDVTRDDIFNWIAAGDCHIEKSNIEDDN